MEPSRRIRVTGLLGAAASVAAFGARAAGTPVLADHPMVAGIWHGRTPLSKADEYKQYLFDVGVKKMPTLPSNRGVQLMMNRAVEQAEFMVMSWDSVDAIKGYAGDNYSRVHDLPREFLIDMEMLVCHFELDVSLWQA